MHAGRSAPLTNEVAVNEPERETAGAVRSSAVAQFFAPSWNETATALAGALERTSRSTSETQVLVVVPDAASATALARELRSLPAAAGLQVLPARDAVRSIRMHRATPAHIVLGSPETLTGMLRASALPLQQVHTVVLAAADEYASDLDTLSAILAEVPRTAARVLVAASATPDVETLLERHLHRARRMSPVVEAYDALPSGAPAIHVRLVTPLAPLEPVGELLDELDPPSAALVAPDARIEEQLRDLLLTLGLAADSSLVVVTRGDVADHTHLVIFAGLPTRDMVVSALNAHPARVVALVSARQRVALQRVTQGARLMPYERSRASAEAMEREEALREAIRHTLAESPPPTREMLTLEPLLATYDGLELAGAALRLYERNQSAARDAKQAGREELRAELREAKARQDAADTRRPNSPGAPGGRGAPPGMGARKYPPRRPR